MGKRIRPWSEELIKEQYDEGRGSGDLETYLGWILARDFNSRGNSTRFTRPRFGIARLVQTLSKLEFKTFNLIDFETNVLDIKENFPLPREITRPAAKVIGIKYPCYPKTAVDVVLTIDFLATRVHSGKTFKQAFLCKTANDLADPREVEKLEIVRAVLERMRIWTKIVLDTQMPQMRCRNIEWIAGGYMRRNQLEDYPKQDKDIKELVLYSLKQSPNSLERLEDFCLEVDSVQGLVDGACLKGARQLFWDRVLHADLNAGDLEDRPVAAITVTGAQGRPRLVGGNHG